LWTFSTGEDLLEAEGAEVFFTFLCGTIAKVDLSVNLPGGK
jgi:hypothetical protein